MGIDPSQPKGDGAEQSPTPSKEDSTPQGLGDLSTDDIDWGELSRATESLDAIPLELRIDPNADEPAYEVEEDLNHVLAERLSDRHRAWQRRQVLGLTPEGRAVVQLEFRRGNDSFIPSPRLLVSGEDIRGSSPNEGGKKRLMTATDYGVTGSDNWERVPGQAAVFITQRCAGHSRSGFSLECRVDSMDLLTKMFEGLEEKRKSGQLSAAQYLVDRYVAERLAEDQGIPGFEGYDPDSPPSYIVISPLSKVRDGIAELSLVVAASSPDDDCLHAYEIRGIQVSLSRAKFIKVGEGMVYSRGPAELYVQHLERQREERRGGAD